MVTIKEIAKECNVSTGSVSRVLNQDKTLKISDKLRRKIIETAKEKHYILPKKRNKYKQAFQKTIGVIHWYSKSQEIDDPYYVDIREGIQNLAAESNVKLILKFRENQGYDLSGFDCVDGIICIGKFSEKQIAAFNQISNHIVYVDFSPDELNSDSIVIDFGDAVEKLLKVVIQKGYKKIGYIGGREFVDKKIALGERREIVFKEFLKKHNLFNQNYVHVGTFSSKSGYELMKKALKKDDYANIYFCANDSIAMGAMRAIYEKQLHIPSDISIVGFNDNFASAFLSPPLSTIQVPTKFMGEQALFSIIEQIEGRNIHIKKCVPTKIVLRESFK